MRFKAQLHSAVVCLGLGVALLVANASPVFGVPARGTFATVQQPDGSPVELRLFGDEFYHWHETPAGFVVIQTPDGWWHYAVESPGGELVPAPELVNVDPPPPGLLPGLREEEPVIADKIRAAKRHLGYFGDDELAAPLQRDAARQTPPGPLPGLPQPTVEARGTVNNLVILAMFSDHSLTTSVRPASEYPPLFNQTSYAVGGATGSVKDYYKEISYGKLTLSSTVTAWVTLPQKESYYGADGATVKDLNVAQMVVDAVNAADTAGVDFSSYDTDNDGWIDAITILHSGYGQEVSGVPSTAIWSHRGWVGQALAVQADGVWVAGYHTEPALRGSSGQNIIRIGVICHETGHFFGLPDLYDVDGAASGGHGNGIGAWGLMASGCWGADGGTSPQTPTHMCLWSKMQLSWIDPMMIHTRANWSLPRVEDNQAAYIIREGLPDAEYFLVSNRQATGFDRHLFNSGGLEILHVDHANLNNHTPYDLAVTFEEADGNWSLMDAVFGSRAEAGDPWPGSTSQTSFDSSTSPNTYSNPSLGGSASSITLSSISSNANPMNFDLQTLVPWLDVPTSAPAGSYNVTWTTAAAATQYELQEATTYTAAGWADNCDSERTFRRDWSALGAVRRVTPPSESDSVYLMQFYDAATATWYDLFYSLRLRETFRVTSSTTIAYDVKYGLADYSKDAKVAHFQIRRLTDTSWTALTTFRGFGMFQWNRTTETTTELLPFVGSECEVRFLVINNAGAGGYWPGYWPYDGLAFDDFSINNAELTGHSWSTLSTTAASPFAVSKSGAARYVYRVRGRAGGAWQDWSNLDQIVVGTAPIVTSATVQDLATATGTDTGLAAALAGYANERSVRIGVVTTGGLPAAIRVAESQAALTTATYVAYTPPNYDGYSLSNSDGAKSLWVQVRNAVGASNQFALGGLGGDIILDRVVPVSTGIAAPAAGAILQGGSSTAIQWGSFTDGSGLKANSVALDYDTNSGAAGYPNSIASGEANDGVYTWSPVPALDSATVRVRATAYDVAGNAGTAANTGDFTIDSTAPTVASLQLRDDDGASSPLTGFTNGQTVDVLFAGVGGGPTQMWLTEDATFASGGWVAYQNPTSFTFATLTEQTKTVYVMLRDAADNRVGQAGDVFGSIALDTTPPQLNPVAATPDPNQPWVDVTYSEVVAFGVLVPGNYVITGTGSPTVQTITHQGGTTYRLVTSAQGIGDPYVVTVSNVADRAGNPVDPAHNQASWTGVPVEVIEFKIE